MRMELVRSPSGEERVVLGTGVWVRPYAPCHGPGDDPYIIHEYAIDQQRRTNFRGTVKSEVT